MNASLGRGHYTFRETAALTGLKISRVREWFRGRPSRSSREQILVNDYQAVDGDPAISFYDAGVSLKIERLT